MRIVFHIGYHKTGTSWLQSRYFAAHPSICMANDAQAPWDDAFLESLIGCSDRKFDPDRSRNLLLRKVESAMATKTTAEVAVVSAERLSGHPFSGGYDSFRIAERIHACAPEAMILCVVRNQLDMILSVYRQLVSEGLAASFDDLLNVKHWKGVGFDLGFYEYDFLIDKYWSLFGKEHVCALPYEQMRNDKEAFLGTLCKFIGVRNIEIKDTRIVNRSLGDCAIRGARFFNHFRRSELNPNPLIAVNAHFLHQIIRGMDVVTRRFGCSSNLLSEENIRNFAKLYEGSNSRLMQQTGINYKIDAAKSVPRMVLEKVSLS